MKFPDSFNLAAVLLVAAVVLAAASAAGVSVPTAARMGGMGGAGFLAGLCFALIRRDEVSAAALCGYGLAVVLTAAVGLALTPEIGLLPTLLLLIFGAASVASLGFAFRRISVNGEAVRLESDWGGLGHGFGGWQLSVPAALLLSAIAFGSIAVGAVALHGQRQGVSGKPEAGKPTAPVAATPDKAG